MSLTSFLVASSTYFWLWVSPFTLMSPCLGHGHLLPSWGSKPTVMQKKQNQFKINRKGKDIKVKSEQCLTGHTFRPTGGVHRQLPCSRGHLAMPWHTHHTMARRDHPCIVVPPRADAGPRHGRGGNRQVRGWSPLACSISPGASIIH